MCRLHVLIFANCICLAFRDQLQLVVGYRFYLSVRFADMLLRTLRLCARGMLVCSLHVLSLPGFAVRTTLALLNLKHLPRLFSARCCVELLLLLKCSVELAGKSVLAC